MLLAIKKNFFSIIAKINAIVKGFNDFQSYMKSIVWSFRSLRYLKIRSLYTIVINQVKFTGIDALPLVSWIALLLGGTVIIQANTNFPKYGIESFIGNLLVIIIARELGPLVTALIVVARSGSAIAAEIATQMQNREIFSLELMGIDTRMYIILPRIVASFTAIFTLIIIFDVIAFFGGYFIALSTVYIPVETFIQTLLDAFTFNDLLVTITKSIIYGILIPLICCYYGLKPRSSFEIPIYVSKAVIRTLLVIFIINAMISVLFYF